MKGIKNILISILIVLVIGQFVQFFTQAISLKPLNGVTIENRLPELSRESWFSSDYQNSMIDYVGDNFGFRSFFIRLNNQLFYSLFKKSISTTVIVGKEYYLFEKPYIDSYYGNDFYGSETVDSNFIKLNIVNRFLENQNTKLLIAIAPNKARFYAEYLPSPLEEEIKISNYEYYRKKFSENNYHIIDINKWFLSIKGTKELPLVSKQGTHYSHYGASLFADSLTGHIEYLLDRKIVHFKIDSLSFEEPEDDTDHDLEKLLNIFTESDVGTYGFPASYHNISSEDAYKPRMIVIGDSFFWVIFKEYFMSCFEETSYWYYYKSVFKWGKGLMPPTKEMDVVRAVSNTDVVVILTSVTNMESLGFGFIDDMYEFLKMTHEQRRDKLIPIYSQTIYGNNTHLELIKEKAAIRNISVDSMIYLDAAWMVDRQLEKLIFNEMN